MHAENKVNPNSSNVIRARYLMDLLSEHYQLKLDLGHCLTLIGAQEKVGYSSSSRDALLTDPRALALKAALEDHHGVKLSDSECQALISIQDKIIVYHFVVSSYAPGPTLYSEDKVGSNGKNTLTTSLSRPYYLEECNEETARQVAASNTVYIKPTNLNAEENPSQIFTDSEQLSQIHELLAKAVTKTQALFIVSVRFKPVNEMAPLVEMIRQHRPFSAIKLDIWQDQVTAIVKGDYLAGSERFTPFETMDRDHSEHRHELLSHLLEGHDVVMIASTVYDGETLLKQIRRSAINYQDGPTINMLNRLIQDDAIFCIDTMLRS